MDGVENDHIVEFDKWCSRCLFRDKTEEDDPCWDCLKDGVALNGQPTMYKKRVE